MNKKRKIHPILLIFYMAIAIGLGSIVIILHEVNRPMKHDQQVAEEIALRSTSLAKVDRTTRFVYDKTEYTVAGTNKKGIPVFVVLTNQGKKARVIDQKSGVNEQVAIQQVRSDPDLKKITSSRFGMIDNKPVWMVSYLNKNNKLVIKTIDFKTGKVLKSVATY